MQIKLTIERFLAQPYEVILARWPEPGRERLIDRDFWLLLGQKCDLPVEFNLADVEAMGLKSHKTD